jgi:hypothetical protein
MLRKDQDSLNCEGGIPVFHSTLVSNIECCVKEVEDMGTSTAARN